MEPFYLISLSGLSWLAGWAMGRSFSEWRAQRILLRHWRNYREQYRRGGGGDD